jgi:hypothetical protein
MGTIGEHRTSRFAGFRSSPEAKDRETRFKLALSSNVDDAGPDVYTSMMNPNLPPASPAPAEPFGAGERVACPSPESGFCGLRVQVCSQPDP